MVSLKVKIIIVMRHKLLRCILLCILFSGAIFAESSPNPNELLENLSPPIIQYKQIPINIKAPVSLPHNERNSGNTIEHKSNSNNSNRKNETNSKGKSKSNNQSGSLFNGILETLGKTIEEAKPSSNNTSNRNSDQKAIEIRQNDIIKKAAIAKAKKIEFERQVKIAAQKLLAEKEEIKRKAAEKAKIINTAKKEANAIATSSTTATTTVKTPTTTPSIIAKNKEKPVTKKSEPKKEVLKKKSKNSFDSLFIKIKALEKKEKWKDISNLLRKNKKASATKEGLVYQILCALNAKKVSYSKIGRIGAQLIKIDKKSSWGNYAQALKYYYGRKPKTDKAMLSLSKALKAKKVAPGASKLYWIITVKKYWILLLIFIGALVGGIDFLIKKKKKKDLENKPEGEESEADDKAESEVEDNRPDGFKGKLYDIKNKLKSIISKVKKKGKKKTDNGNVEDQTDTSSEDIEESEDPDTGAGTDTDTDTDAT